MFFSTYMSNTTLIKNFYLLSSEWFQVIFLSIILKMRSTKSFFKIISLVLVICRIFLYSNLLPDPTKEFWSFPISFIKKIAPPPNFSGVSNSTVPAKKTSYNSKVKTRSELFLNKNLILRQE